MESGKIFYCCHCLTRKIPTYLSPNEHYRERIYSNVLVHKNVTLQRNCHVRLDTVLLLNYDSLEKYTYFTFEL